LAIGRIKLEHQAAGVEYKPCGACRNDAFQQCAADLFFSEVPRRTIRFLPTEFEPGGFNVAVNLSGD
jgi:hypothetical protein